MTAFLLAFMIILAMLFSYQKSIGMRESIIKSYVILFLLIATSTEIASLFDAITFHVITLFWVALTFISLLFTLLFMKSPNFGSSIRKSLRTVVKYGIFERLSLTLIVVILASTLLIALLAPPNNSDSMTYHMARVVEWIQHKNVDFYPTSIDRQNYQMPLAEFAILHLQLLSNSDTFANIVQWYSFFIAILFASLIAKEFQTSIRVQFFSAVVVATIPMAILQSSSTQNDIVAGAFCLGFAYFLLKFIRTLSFQNATFCSLTLGLALLTKGTTYIFCFAIGLIIGTVHLLAPKTWKTRWILLSRLALVVLAGLLINVRFFSRNYALYGHPIDTEGNLYKNEEFSTAILFSNLIRNAALHLGTPLKRLNGYTYRAIQILLGSELNNPKTTWGKSHFNIPFSRHEDNAGNLLHLMLIGLVFLMLPVVKMNNKRTVYCYASSVLFAAVLYCIVLKWQPWASRLHTPIFMLSAPLVALVLSRVSFRFNMLFTSLTILLFIYCIPFVLLNNSLPLRPIIGLVFLMLPVVKMNNKRTVYCYASSVLFAAVLYCIVLKWQPWASRLRTPIFMLSAPLVAVVLSRVSFRSNMLFTSLTILLFIYCIPFVLHNRSRPLRPIEGYSIVNTNRLRQYFKNRPFLFEDYKDAIKVVMAEGKDKVGLYLGWNDWEYPLWVLAKRFQIKGVPQFRHVGVTDISSRLEKQHTPAPAIVLATKDVNGNIILGKEYIKIFESKHIRVFKLKAP